MDFWLIGLIAAGVLVLYLVLLGVGVLLGIGSVLMQMHQSGGGIAAADAERRATLRAARSRIEAKANGGTVLTFPPRNRQEKRARMRRRAREA